ncbi:hypothetical protein JNB_20278 [Janibacter sp. HTCC2649]|uniref:hypothetical protein n=1 Tax=Janibacter sp. HTCC2649 TaxID=313589 RepID=UPI000066F63B|nr:hypothetical protein [Janibacter sp. HTCC2649]EAP96984.1 hypothetical protein JNB_20278 [Janibacter sp. HTCC2649]
MNTDQIQDTISREIQIDAPRAIVWELVSQPGWWINDGAITDNTVEEKDGVWHVTNATHGRFPLLVDDTREQSYVAFRWAPWDERAVETGNTLVEFFLEGPDDGPVTVRVLESGFASIDLAPEKVAENYRDNESGWETELGALKTHLEGR